MDRFDAMQAFARVVETGSFTRAAETLNISRTTATQLVQQLEARLQVKLLSRTTRKVKVTDAGDAFYHKVIRLLADVEQAESSVLSAHRRVEGRLRVDVPSPLARMILIPALPDFYRQYPGIRVNMRVSDRRVDLLDENIDCVIRGGPVIDQSLIARRLGELRLMMYAAPSYLQAFGEPITPEQLQGPDHRVVGYLWAHKNYTLRRHDESVSILGNYALAVDDGNAYLTAGLAGLGVLWLPDYMAREALAQGELVPVLTDWQLEPMPLQAVFHPSRRDSAKVRVFIDWVASCLTSVS